MWPIVIITVNIKLVWCSLFSINASIPFLSWFACFKSFFSISLLWMFTNCLSFSIYSWHFFDKYSCHLMVLYLQAWKVLTIWREVLLVISHVPFPFFNLSKLRKMSSKAFNSKPCLKSFVACIKFIGQYLYLMYSFTKNWMDTIAFVVIMISFKSVS